MIICEPPSTRIYDEPNLAIEYDAVNKLIIQHWRGFSTSKQFREGIKKSVEVSKEVNSVRLLVDIREASVVKPEDTAWATSYGFGNMLQNGLKAVAFVIPLDELVKLSLSQVKMYSRELPLAIQYFENDDTAMAWLLAPIYK